MELDQREAKLIEEAKTGSQEAFDSLVKQHLPMIFRYLFRLCGSSTTAEDLTQETFLRVWKHIERFDSKKPFRPWILRIARNCAFDHLRKKKTLPFSFLTEPEQYQLENIPANSASPKDIFEQKETAEFVKTMLSQLTEKEKEILVMHYLDELTVPEIAEILKKPEETIRTRLRRAREAFREVKEKNEPSITPNTVSINSD